MVLPKILVLNPARVARSRLVYRITYAFSRLIQRFVKTENATFQTTVVLDVPAREVRSLLLLSPSTPPPPARPRAPRMM